MKFTTLMALLCGISINTYANNIEAYKPNQLAQQQVIQTQLKTHQNQIDITTYQNLSNQIYSNIDTYQKQLNHQAIQLNQTTQQLQILSQKYKNANCSNTNKNTTCQKLISEITLAKQQATSQQTQFNQVQAQLRLYLEYAQELEQKSLSY